MDSEAQAGEQIDNQVADVANEVSCSGEEVGEGSSQHDDCLSTVSCVIYSAPELFRRHSIVTRWMDCFKRFQ